MSIWLCTALDFVNQIGQLQKPGCKVCAHLAQLPLNITRKRRISFGAEEENTEWFCCFFGSRNGWEQEAQQIELTTLIPVFDTNAFNDDYHSSIEYAN